MTTVKILRTDGIVKDISEIDNYNVKIVADNYNEKITDLSYGTQSIKEISPNVKITPPQNSAKLSAIYPFRVRFTNVFLPGYVPGRSLPIGLAVIGFSNYIL